MSSSRFTEDRPSGSPSGILRENHIGTAFGEKVRSLTQAKNHRLLPMCQFATEARQQITQPAA